MVRALLVALVFVAGLEAQTPVIIPPGQTIGFDYLNADVTTYAVVGFQVSYDAQPFDWVISTLVVLPDTIPGGTTYRMQLPFTTGTHTMQVRACNPAGCGQATALYTFSFAVVSPPLPVNTRVTP